MQKYRVFVHGQNLLAEIQGVRQRFGFYTYVFVEAFTVADAEAKAIELISVDAPLRDMALNAKNDELKFSADEVQEIESFEGLRLPRTGISLYAEDSGKSIEG